MTAESYKELAKKFIDKYDLNHGNGYVEESVNISRFGYRYITLIVEAPDNWTNQIRVDIKDLPTEEEFAFRLKRNFMGMVNNLDVDEYFNELWSSDFGEHNSFTPTVFLRKLMDDKDYYKEVVERMVEEYNENSKS